jgi:hypothetical protein
LVEAVDEDAGGKTADKVGVYVDCFVVEVEE